MMSARAIVKSLGGMWCGRYGLARCPVHDDRKPSLKIRDDPNKRDGIDLHCFAGCPWQDIKAAFARQGLIEAWSAKISSAPACLASPIKAKHSKPPLSPEDRTRIALSKWDPVGPAKEHAWQVLFHRAPATAHRAA
jgi:hypothetical protein